MKVNQRIKRVVQLIGLLGISLMLSSCSMRFTYNQLDWLLPWYIDDYVSVDAHQKPKLNHQINQFLSWHRSQQLPAYASFVKKLKSSIQSSPSKQQIETLLYELEDLIDALYLGVGQHFVRMLTSLSTEQKEEFLHNLTEKNIDYAEDYVNVGESAARKMGLEKITDIYSDWLGELTSDQTKMIQRFAQRTQWMAPDFLHAKQKRTEAMRRVLFQAEGIDQNQDDLLTLFANRKVFWNNRLQQKFNENRTLLEEHLKQIFASLTPQQTKHLLDKLSEYRQDFLELSTQTP